MSVWFGLKAVPGGTPVSSGPYQSVELANADRRKLKGTHTEVTPWFFAENQDQADAIAKWHFDGGTRPKPE